jgi:hypothetical protein
MRLRTSWVALCLMGFLAVSPAVGSSATGDAVVRSLEHGDVDARLDALVKILRIPVEQRDDRTWRALERETTRMLGLRRHPPKNRTEEERDTSSAYAVGLVRALGESRNLRTFHCWSTMQV